jgi:hypothetical protein
MATILDGILGSRAIVLLFCTFSKIRPLRKAALADAGFLFSDLHYRFPGGRCPPEGITSEGGFLMNKKDFGRLGLL